MAPHDPARRGTQPVRDRPRPHLRSRSLQRSPRPVRCGDRRCTPVHRRGPDRTRLRRVRGAGIDHTSRLSKRTSPRVGAPRPDVPPRRGRHRALPSRNRRHRDDPRSGRRRDRLPLRPRAPPCSRLRVLCRPHTPRRESPGQRPRRRRTPAAERDRVAPPPRPGRRGDGPPRAGPIGRRGREVPTPLRPVPPRGDRRGVGARRRKRRVARACPRQAAARHGGPVPVRPRRGDRARRGVTDLPLIALFGLAVGFIGGYAGIGGAPFLVFLLGAVLGWPQHAAQGTVLAVMLGPMTLPGVLVMQDRIRPLLRYVVIGVVTYAAFSYLGAEIAYLFDNQTLRILFSILLLGLGIRHMTARITKPAVAGAPLFPLNAASMTLLGAFVGVAGGTFGIGAGVLLVPLLGRLFAMEKDDARAISLAILLPPVSIGAVVKYHSRGDVDWLVVAVCFAAYLASNHWGAKLGRAHSAHRFRFFLGSILLAGGILYLWQSIRLF
ncbi:MAG: TSUP family transporter [Candidatus Eisenbacteria bacterium]|nr:TSUP family transporter [Candidatus Latescibacterota bacterium]MBD3302577.1 TSUP family transporter [Candidatus Eisenbacteria bacterium]